MIRHAFAVHTKFLKQGMVLGYYKKCPLGYFPSIRRISSSVRSLQDPSIQQQETSSSASSFESRPHFPHLFSPLNLGADIGYLPNRVIMGSMHTGLEGNSIPKFILPFLGPVENHDTLEAMATYFERRAQGGVGLMVTGGISPNKTGWVGPFAAKLDSRYEMELHKVVTERVHGIRIPSTSNPIEGEKARICLQILHAGRYAMHPFPLSASTTKSPISPFKAREMSLGQIQLTIHDYVRCATLAKEAGYDGVEIMGSEGYLINQFLVKRTNKRVDHYGGDDFCNRMRFAVDIVKKTREATGKDFIIIFRLSMLDLIHDGSSWEEIQILAQAVEDAGATIINTGIGWHEARVPTIATLVPRGAFAWVTKKLRDDKIVSIPLCATNRINAPHVAENILASQSADLVSMARPFLADPDILKKSMEGNVGEINTCIGCNQACLDHSFIGKTASCLVNPSACHEEELNIVPNSIPKNQRMNIGVVGAGPAGLSFAITAATIGHKVLLFDKSKEIGGQFNMAKRVPGKEEFHETIRYFSKRIQTLCAEGNLEVLLEREVLFSDMIESNNSIDKWIIATGVEPRKLSIPGIDHPNVLSYVDVLRSNAAVGRKVAIIGAGGIGFDVAEFLLHQDDFNRPQNPDAVSVNHFLTEWGVDSMYQSRGGLARGTTTSEKSLKRELFLLQRKKGKLGLGLGKTTGWIHRSTLLNSKCVEMLDSVSYDEIDHKGHLHVTIDGKKRILETDNIVICAGQVSKRDLHDKGWADKVFTIGGAYEALELDAKRAIDMGTRLALSMSKDLDPRRCNAPSKIGSEEKLFKLFRGMMQ